MSIVLKEGWHFPSFSHFKKILLKYTNWQKIVCLSNLYAASFSIHFYVSYCVNIVLN